MKKSFLLLSILCVLCVSAQRNDTAFKLMMNQMAVLIDGPGAQFNQTYYNKLVGSMSDRILESQNKAWQGFIDYWDTNGTDTDHWGICETFPQCYVYMDHHPERIPYHNMIIYEPCNYVSNVAYYHVFTSIVDHQNWNIDATSVRALGEGFNTLAYGSSFYHASFTFLGNAWDNKFIGVIFFTLYQASFKNLDVPREVRELSETPRTKTGIQTTDELVTLLITKPPAEWTVPINTADIPNYFLTIPCVVITIFTLSLPDKAVDAFLRPVMTKLLVNQQFQDYIFDKYIPAIRKATSHLVLSTSVQIKLFFRLIAVLSKMMYSFVFQEWMLPSQFFKEPWVNAIGALLMPTFNQFMTILSGFKHTDFNLENSIHVYPGDSTCRVEQPHSKWHEESASLLLDLVFLVDYVVEITQ